MALCVLEKISLAYGLHHLFQDLNLSLEKGEKVGLIGRNGAGKTTLMRLLQGKVQIDSGTVKFQRENKVSYLSQKVPLDMQGSVFDVIVQGLADTGKLLVQYHHILAQMEQCADEALLAELEKVQHALEAVNGWQLEQQVEAMISRLSLDGQARIEALSGGLKRRVLLAKALISDPDILLLDEPTNHLDIASILWLEDFIRSYEGCVLVVTHDRMFLQNIATRIIELDRGSLYSFPGDYQNYLRRKEEMLQAEERQNNLFDKKLAEEEVWIRQGIKARRTRNEGRVRALKAMREERKQRQTQQGKVKLELEAQRQSGKIVVEAENISYTLNDSCIIKDFSSIILRGDKIGVLGSNGAGKTTLLRLLLSELALQTGTLQIGSKLDIAYFDQYRAGLNEQKTVLENIAEGKEFLTINGKQRHVYSYLQDFLFTSKRAKMPVHALSGGERNRLLLARLFSRPTNLLVLDEPTNDLDAETLELLEALLIDYPGTLLLVSHDRSFLNNVVSSLFVFEGKGKVSEYVGGYDDWLSMQKQHESSLTSSATTMIEHKKQNTEKKKIAIEKKKTGTLTYKERIELEQLPEQIETLEIQQQELETLMGETDFYQQDYQAIQKVNEKLAVLTQQLEKAYSRWDELESK